MPWMSEGFTGFGLAPSHDQRPGTIWVKHRTRGASLIAQVVASSLCRLVVGAN